MTTQPEPTATGRDPNQRGAVGERPGLINVAYRLLGSVADAEDVVQETYARWYAMSREQREAIESPGAWLTKVASRICLDLLGSARARRERYVGPWLPEPVPDRTEWIDGDAPGSVTEQDDPADRVTLDESVGMAFLVVLESMTPAERVSLVLHDVFGYSFAEVADILGRTPAACRQLASSARRRVGASPIAPTSVARRSELVRDFKRAWEAKDIEALVDLLDPEATVIADGGGLAAAVTHPLEGAGQIARYYADLGAWLPDDIVLVECTVNGQPGLVIQQDGIVNTVFAFGIVADRITHVYAVRNPDKLRAWQAG